MASGIPSNNFNVPKQFKTAGSGSVPNTSSEHKPSGDAVELTGTGFATAQVSGLAALVAQANPNLTPAEMKEVLVEASKGGTLDAAAALEAARKRAPIHLSMDEATGVGIIGDSQKADAGHGLTGLNSINSVVSSGKFEGLNGSYGAARPFGL